MAGQDPVVKHSPADFVVRENLVVDLVPRDAASHQYLLLRKSGYTTFEAIRLIAAELDVPPGEVSYAGLKDEDGITEQLVAVTAPGMDGPDRTIADGPTRRLELRHYGYGTAPLAVGRLNGNGFRTVIRNLDGADAERLAGTRQHTTFFLNYYDIQRFGVPGGKKLTHLVGEAILGDDWDTALKTLGELGTPESAQARDWTGGGREFFRQLEPRVTAFYCAAHASFQWNTALRELTLETCPRESRELRIEGLHYVYVTSPQAAIRVLNVTRDLPNTRYAFTEGQPRATATPRATVVQTALNAENPAPDEFFSGRSRVTLSFFLPSGCYATAALRQILGYRQ
jgi:tRNA pseudouridine13 synthase